MQERLRWERERERDRRAKKKDTFVGFIVAVCLVVFGALWTLGHQFGAVGTVIGIFSAIVIDIVFSVWAWEEYKKYNDLPEDLDK